MNPEDVADILDDVTNRLAPASEAAWNLMVTEAKIASFLALAICAILVVIVVVGNVLAFKQDREHPVDRYSDSIPWKVVSLGFSGIVAIPAFLFLLYNGLVGVFIPEYHVLNRFLSILQGS